MKTFLINLLPNNLKKILLFIYNSYFDKPIINLYKTNYSKNVLISYIKYPFVKWISYSHTNTVESLAIAEVFSKLEYNVDITNYYYEWDIDYSKYDLIFWFWDTLTNSFYDRKRKIITIYYWTWMHIFYQNYETIKRIEDNYMVTWVWMPESWRIVEKNWSIQTQLVDAMICMWNNEVIKSYKKYYDKKIYNIPVTFYKINNYISEPNKLNFWERKKNFIFFSSSGLLHRWLDILLDIFKENKNINLHICCPIDNEVKFKEYYYNYLYNTSNIFTYWFMDITSEDFSNLVNKCAFTIFPSCSEWEPSSIVNLMSLWIVPIITKTSWINPELWIEIKNLNRSEIEKSLKLAYNINESEYFKLSSCCLQKTLDNNSIENYKLKLEQNLIDIINKHEMQNM